jgi:nitrate/TMAO reductase-like tetraheme cytochrome c subunit
MNSLSGAEGWARPLYYLCRNTISLVGVVLTTSSATTLIAFWIYDFALPGPPHPYIGILLFLILPALFVAGLILIPIGMVLYRRRLLARRELPEVFPPIDLQMPAVRRTLLLVAFATFLNILIFTFASYKGVSYMDGTTFCGQTCHTVMTPEYTAYQNSPHSRVHCVDCHIGSGVGWFVRAKVSGVRQLYEVAFNTYSRPIPTPVKNLRSALGTCEQCHWPQRFSGDKFIVKTNYKDDEKNTPLTTVLGMKIGGRTSSGAVGIHGKHVDDGYQIHYISTDERRQVIPVVYYTDDKGRVVEYVSTDNQASKQELEKGERRTMDCIDCHNRPAHTFELPENGVDLRMSRGLIDPELPYIRQKAVEMLKVKYTDREAAQKQIVDGIKAYYRTSYPDVYKNKATQIEQSAGNIAKIYLRNSFPDMNVTWGTYPSNLGHNDSPGCFRCHDGLHTSADGQTISNDCTVCHNLLAVQEENPKILTDLGLK